MSRALSKVSVVLPAYNAAATLRTAIDSILRQDHGNLELIVVDDGSTDGTGELLSAVDDPRVETVRQENRGVAEALNTGLSVATGDLIARQDADDESLAGRLSAQVRYLEQHPDHGLVGTWASISSAGMPTKREIHHPTANGALQFDLNFESPFVHPSVMLRRSALDQSGPYRTDADIYPPEDFDLWQRISERWKIGNIGRVLLRYNASPEGVSQSQAERLERNALRLAVNRIVGRLDGECDPAVARTVAQALRRSHGSRPAPFSWKSAMILLARLRMAEVDRHPDDAAQIDWAFTIARRRLMTRWMNAMGIRAANRSAS